jgi:hypothetical protein
VSAVKFIGYFMKNTLGNFCSRFFNHHLKFWKVKVEKVCERFSYK